jgi:hypothetical protein
MPRPARSHISIKHDSIDFCHCPSIRRKRARDELAAPLAGLSRNPIEVVSGWTVFRLRHLRCRGNSDCRNPTLRPFQIDHGTHVIMSVQDELGPVPLQCRPQLRSVDEPLETSTWARVGRVVNEDRAKPPFAATEIEERGKPVNLGAPKPAGGHERSRRNGTRQADERKQAAPPQEGKLCVGTLLALLAAHVSTPMRAGMPVPAAHINVVISRYQGHI